MVQDYWNIPVFGQLLEITQRELSGYIVGGEGTAAEAMNRMAEEHEAILKDTGS
jgi:multiple sugar transport system substrate-binding protein